MLERPIAIGIHEAAPGTRAAAANEGELAELHAAVSPLVDGEWYKAKYPHDGESAYLHFMTVGVAADANPNPYFDTRWYRETYPHYREHTDNPLVHYVLRGWLEGAQPSPRFDAVRYLTDYPDVRAEQFEPLTHFLSHGRFERRRVYALDGAKPGAPTQPAIVPPATAKPTLTAPAAAELEDCLNALLRDLTTRCAATGPVSAIFALPIFGRGGSEKVALSFADVFLRSAPGKSALLLVTDFNVADETISPPEGVHILKLDDYARGLDHRARQDLLFRLLQAIRPYLFHIINSDLAWSLLRDRGERVKAHTRVFGSIFCVQRDYDTGEPIGYAATYLPTAQTYCEAILTDNARFAEEGPRLFGEAGPAHIVPVLNPLSWPGDPPIRAARPKRAVTMRRPPTVLWAGRMDRQKRFELLCAVAERMPTFQFDVFGGSVTDGDVKARPLPNVRVRGGFRRSADVLAADEYVAYMHTTHEEGLPNILLEVGSHGLPVVAPDIGGISELIGEDTGYLVSARAEPREYERALRAIVADPAKARLRAERLRALIETNHSWSAFRQAVSALPHYLRRGR